MKNYNDLRNAVETRIENELRPVMAKASEAQKNHFENCVKNFWSKNHSADSLEVFSTCSVRNLADYVINVYGK